MEQVMAVVLHVVTSTYIVVRIKDYQLLVTDAGLLRYLSRNVTISSFLRYVNQIGYVALNSNERETFIYDLCRFRF